MSKKNPTSIASLAHRSAGVSSSVMQLLREHGAALRAYDEKAGDTLTGKLSEAIDQLERMSRALPIAAQVVDGLDDRARERLAAILADRTASLLTELNGLSEVVHEATNAVEVLCSEIESIRQGASALLHDERARATKRKVA